MKYELDTKTLYYIIYVFNIHIRVLILIKGVIYSSTSCLISDNIELGWRYLWVELGRGGTCQVSPYDQVYPATFWVYNTISIAILARYGISYEIFGVSLKLI